MVVDNSPHLPEGQHVKTLIEHWAPFGNAGARYIAMPESPGTTQTRERIFREAAGEAVLVMDCHVLLAPGAIRRLIAYYADHPDCRDLLQGPLVMDDMRNFMTHFDNIWRAQMWGTWGSAWSCPCGDTHFTVFDTGGKTDYRQLDAAASTLGVCDRCAEMPPELDYAGHEATLEALGFRRLGRDPDEKPFEIPAQGLGVFSCRRDAWPGFNPHMRGFGGEEWYIHEKFRQRGDRCLCLPFLRWVHRFGRPGGTKYTPTLWNKVRNYVLGHQELGLPLDRVKEHFVEPGALSPRQWEYLVEDPIARPTLPVEHHGGCDSCKKDLADKDIDGVFEYYAAQQNDFNQHFAKLKELAGRCEHVTEFGKRDYGVAALAGGHPRRIRSYNQQTQGAAYWRLEQLAKDDPTFSIVVTHENHLEADIEETDLLFIDNHHNARQLEAELNRHAPRIRRYIVLHDTELHGFHGDDGGPGLKPALIQFMRQNPEWTVVYSTTNQYGLMVLSKNPADKPKRPSIITMGGNYIKHLAEYVADGIQDVSKEHLEARLEICWLCDLRTAKEQCSLCGCPLVPKAKRRASYCDANKWREVDARFEREEDHGDTENAEEKR